MKNFLSFCGFFSIVSLLVLILVPLLFPKWLYLSTEIPVKADYIVQLLGSVPERSLETATLYNKNFSEEIIFIHENIDLYKPLIEQGIVIPTDSDLVKSALLQLNIPIENISILPGKTLSTQDEAITLAEHFISQNDAGVPLPKQILVVTSKFHSGRSDRIFEKVFSKYKLPVKINTVASRYDVSNPTKWYKNREDIASALMEGLKNINFLLIEQFKISPKEVYR
ncbi:MAG: YdcF family protein [Caldisericia bacterium]|nr:YdcF family protein [Caldisericia bacterium]